MANLTNEEIILAFKKASISISKVECKGPENGMICTIYRGSPSFFSSYYMAFDFFNRKNLLN
jgi:hypothetical protein